MRELCELHPLLFAVAVTQADSNGAIHLVSPHIRTDRNPLVTQHDHTLFILVFRYQFVDKFSQALNTCLCKDSGDKFYTLLCSRHHLVDCGSGGMGCKGVVVQTLAHTGNPGAFFSDLIEVLHHLEDVGL